jgi:hypothetical protein
MASKLITTLQQAILRSSESQDALAEVFVLINELPLGKLNYFERIKLLQVLIKAAYEVEANPQLVNFILNKWTGDDGDVEAVMGDLASIITFSPMLLQYIAKTLPDSSVESVLMALLESNYNNYLPFGIVCDRLTAAYGTEIAPETWVQLYEIAQQKQIAGAMEYFRSKMAPSAAWAPVPKWVSLQEGETLALLETVQEADHETTDQLYDEVMGYIQENFRIKAVPTEGVAEETTVAQPNLEEVVQTYLATTTAEEIAELIETGPKIESLVPIERIWGPSNLILGRNCPAAPGGKGPCRMLYCQCRESDELDENAEINPERPFEWFSSNCQNSECHRRIRDPSHALRFPIAGGGWIGCYCSEKCMLSEPARPTYEDQCITIEAVMSVLQKHGIIDRFKLQRRVAKEVKPDTTVPSPAAPVSSIAPLPPATPLPPANGGAGRE